MCKTCESLQAELTQLREQLEELKILARVPKPGFDCQACGHRHAAEHLGFICIGCPCEMQPE